MFCRLCEPLPSTRRFHHIYLHRVSLVKKRFLFALTSRWSSSLKENVLFALCFRLFLFCGYISYLIDLS